MKKIFWLVVVHGSSGMSYTYSMCANATGKDLRSFGKGKLLFKVKNKCSFMLSNALADRFLSFGIRFKRINCKTNR